MNEFFHCPFANVILEHCSYRSSFTNELVHVSFMFDSFMNNFYSFHFYPSSFRERTKTPAFFRSCSMFVHLRTNECSFVLAVVMVLYDLHAYKTVIKIYILYFARIQHEKGSDVLGP